MTGGPSVWWPIDVPASRWFSEDERQASRSYHEPIERVVLVRATAQLAALIGLWIWLAQRSSDADLRVVVVATLLAISLPRLGADAWHEFVHEPRFGGVPVRRVAFAATALGRFAVEGLGLGLVALALSKIDDGSPWAAAGAAALGAGAIPAVSAWLGPRTVLALHRVVDVDSSHPAHLAVDDAARHFGLARPRLVVLDGAVFEGANAYVVGRRSTSVVAVSRSLLDGPADLLAHVVSHEMAHVARRHGFWSAVASAAAFACSALVAVLITLGWTRGAAGLPLLIVVAVLVAGPFRLVSAWISRAHERRADHLALDVAPVAPQLVARLHLSDRPQLEPSRLVRALHSHPAPPERVECAARRSRRSFGARSVPETA